jgi:hypothetical protein
MAANLVAGAASSAIGEIETAISIDPATQNPTSASSAMSTFLGSRDEIITTQSFTQFRSETDTVEATVNTTLPDSVSDNRYDAKRILANPRVLKQGTLTTNFQVFPTNSFDFGYTFFNKTPVKNIVNNFVGMTFTMCVDVKISTDPFQSGMWYLVFIPPGYTDRTRVFSTDATYNPHHKVMTCCEFLPHVKIDIQENPTGLLKVKFYFPVNFYETPTLGAAGTLGQFALISSLSGAQVTGEPEFTMLGWLEDIEFRYPGDVDTVTPRAALSRKKRVVPDVVPVPVPTPSSLFDAVTRFVAQQQGPELKSHIPGKCLVTAPRAFTTTAFIDDAQGAPNISYPYCPKPSLIQPDGSASDSFNDLFKQRSFLGVLPWAKTLVASDLIGSIAVNPSPNLTIASTLVPFPDNLSAYTGNFTRSALAKDCFNLHSGEMTFHLKIPKTKFHSGKIQVAYLPGMNHNLANLDWSKHWNTIINVKEGSEFEITVVGTPSTYNYYRDTVWGTLVFRVYNKIICPDNVIQNLSILVYSSADLQVKSPSYPRASGRIYINNFNLTVAAEQQGLASSLPTNPLPPLVTSTAINVINEGRYSGNPVKMVRASLESIKTKPQMLITDGNVSCPSFTTNNDDLTISEYLNVCSTGGASIDNARTVNFPTDGTEAIYLQSLLPSIIYAGITARLPINNFCMAHSINSLLSIFQGVRCDTYFGTGIAPVTDTPLNPFLVNSYNYGTNEYNGDVAAATSKNFYLTAPYDSNLIYGPYTYRSVKPGKSFETNSCCLLNFQGFYPWYPSVTSPRAS